MSTGMTRSDVEVAHPMLLVGGCTIQIVELSNNFAIEVTVEGSQDSEINRRLVRAVIKLASGMRLSGDYPAIAALDERTVDAFNCMGSANSMTSYRGGEPVYWAYWGAKHGTREYRLVRSLYVDAIERVRSRLRTVTR